MIPQNESQWFRQLFTAMRDISQRVSEIPQIQSMLEQNYKLAGSDFNEAYPLDSQERKDLEKDFRDLLYDYRGPKYSQIVAVLMLAPYFSSLLNQAIDFYETSAKEKGLVWLKE